MGVVIRNRWRAQDVTGLTDGAAQSTTVPGSGIQGTGLAQTTAGNRPAWRSGANGIGGKAAWQFDPSVSAQWLQSTAQVAGGDPVTWVVVHRPMAPKANWEIFHLPSGEEMYWDGNAGMWGRSSGLESGVSPTLDAPQVWTGVYGSATGSFRINGTVRASGDTGVAGVFGSTLVVGATGSGTKGYRGLIAEVIQCEGAVSDGDLHALHSELQDYYAGAFTVSDYVSTGPVPPVANAGPDQTIQATYTAAGVAGPTVTLTGAASTDSDGTVTSYAWTQLSGAAVTLSGSGATRTFTAPRFGGTLVFGLTVTDDDGASSTQDTVTVTVTGVPYARVRAASAWVKRPLFVRTGGAWG